MLLMTLLWMTYSVMHGFSSGSYLAQFSVTCVNKWYKARLFIHSFILLQHSEIQFYSLNISGAYCHEDVFKITTM